MKFGLKQAERLQKFLMRRRGRFILGFDQGTCALRYVLWDREKRQIAGWKQFDLDAREGDHKRRTVVETLKEIIRELPKNQIAAVHLHLQGEFLITGHLELAADHHPADAARVRAEMRSRLGFPIDRAAYLWREIAPRVPLSVKTEADSQEAKNLRTIHYAACQKTALLPLIEMVTALFELVPEVTTQGYAFEGLLDLVGHHNESGATALVSGGRSITSISIFKQNRLVFEREIPLAGQDITRSIFIHFLQGKSLHNANDLSIAETFKKKSFIAGYPPAATLAGLSPAAAPLNEEANHRLGQSMQGVLGAWVQDLRLSFAYFNEHYDPIPITQILFLGGMANHQNLDRYLCQELNIPVETLVCDPTKISVSPGVPGGDEWFKHFNEYAMACALALKEPGDFSLTPTELRRVDWNFLLKPALRIFSATALIFCIAAFGVLRFQKSHLQQVRKIIAEHRGFLNLLEGPFSEMTRWEQFFAHADYDAMSAPDFLKQLARITPENMLLVKLVVNRRSLELYMEGSIYGDAKKRAITLAEFTRALKESGGVEHLEVPLWEPSSSGIDKGVFKLTARFVTRKGGTA